MIVVSAIDVRERIMTILLTAVGSTGESLPFILRRRSEGPSSALEVIGRSGHPTLMLAWIYEAGNKVVTGVGLSLVAYAEGKRRIMLEVAGRETYLGAALSTRRSNSFSPTMNPNTATRVQATPNFQLR
jgi:hypothetical protein